MQTKIDGLKKEVWEKIAPYIDAGGDVSGYGASPTATTLMYALELQHRLNCLFDDNPIKHGLLSPGRHLPVYSSAELATRRPAVTILLAWNYADPILRRNEAYLTSGGKFLIPLPNLRIV